MLAAVRAADLGGAHRAAEQRGMRRDRRQRWAVRVRTLAIAARLLRAARKVGQYGIDVRGRRCFRAVLRLCARCRDVRSPLFLLPQIDALELLCARTPSRPLRRSGHVDCTPTAAWRLTSVPPRWAAAAARGCVCASIFHALVLNVELFEAGDASVHRGGRVAAWWPVFREEAWSSVKLVSSVEPLHQTSSTRVRGNPRKQTRLPFRSSAICLREPTQHERV